MTASHALPALARGGFTAFDGSARLAFGGLPEVALAVKRAVEAGAPGPVLIFDDATGQVVDLHTRGSDEDLLARAALRVAGPVAKGSTEVSNEPRGRGRPKLGVVAREVTLLPRHWEWLAEQPGGASVALRKLVEAARRVPDERSARRRAHERSYAFMSTMAGHLPGFEEASRALFADDLSGLRKLSAPWPKDVRLHVLKLFASSELGDTSDAEPAVPS